MHGFSPWSVASIAALTLLACVRQWLLNWHLSKSFMDWHSILFWNFPNLLITFLSPRAGKECCFVRVTTNTIFNLKIASSLIFLMQNFTYFAKWAESQWLKNFLALAVRRCSWIWLWAVSTLKLSSYGHPQWWFEVGLIIWLHFPLNVEFFFTVTLPTQGNGFVPVVAAVAAGTSAPQRAGRRALSSATARSSGPLSGPPSGPSSGRPTAPSTAPSTASDDSSDLRPNNHCKCKQWSLKIKSSWY